MLCCQSRSQLLPAVLFVPLHATCWRQGWAPGVAPSPKLVVGCACCVDVPDTAPASTSLPHACDPTATAVASSTQLPAQPHNATCVHMLWPPCVRAEARMGWCQGAGVKELVSRCQDERLYARQPAGLLPVLHSPTSELKGTPCLLPLTRAARQQSGHPTLHTHGSQTHHSKPNLLWWLCLRDMQMRWLVGQHLAR